MQYLRKLWNEKTLLCILLLAFVSRLVAVIFARGFGMHDDHFLVIEAAQSWVDGTDYNNWLPWSPDNAGPDGHSFFYSGIHYILFTIIKFLNIDNPQMKMIIIRLIHALWSLLVVYFGYKITEKAAGKKLAVQTGLMLALLWFFPWISVRNLVEVVSIPFLIWAIWLIYSKQQENKFDKAFLWAGFLFGLAFSTRFQTALFISGVGLVMLIRQQWKPILFLMLGFAVAVFIFEGLVDWMMWGRPFAEMKVYIQYNIDHSNDYIISAWYTYILLLAGMLLPPVSLFLIAGFFRSWKKYLLLFLPTFIFLAFHSTFPNKQERFVMTIIPFLIISAMLGWDLIISNSTFWQKRKKLLKVCWIIFWVLNFLLMPVISTHYSKRARVESMRYISHYLENEPNKLRYANSYYLLVENSNASSNKLPPEFYLGHWILSYDINLTCTVDSIYNTYAKNNPEYSPKFFLFEDQKLLAKRINHVREFFPNIEYETTIEPGYIDKLLYRLNPINANQTIVIFRNKDFYPQKMHIE
ncbi:MAG: glycosyltransferase family 39 protein [Bacteroidetes bacterium]|nr:glycosyltransferase family 39 protein [Bacteroidota bacterium]